VALAGHRYVVLLHGCSSADWVLGLARLISSAIRSWAKIGPLTSGKLRRPLPELSSKTSEPDDVGGHQVGRELDALGIEPQHLTQRLDQQRLGEARPPMSSAWPPERMVTQRSLDHPAPVRRSPRGGFLDALDPLAGRFDAGDDGVVGLRECCHDLPNYTLRRPG